MIQDLTIIRNDYTFATKQLNRHQPYGRAGDCGNACTNPPNTSSMDLSGTGFYVTSGLTQVSTYNEYHFNYDFVSSMSTQTICLLQNVTSKRIYMPKVSLQHKLHVYRNLYFEVSLFVVCVCIMIFASDNRYWDLSSEAGPQEVQRSQMPKLKAAKGSVYFMKNKDSSNINKLI